MKEQQLIDDLTLLFSKYGVSLSMADIARFSGLSKKALYEHFENKEDLVMKVLESSRRNWENFLDEALRKKEDPLLLVREIYFKRFELTLQFNPFFITEAGRRYSKVSGLYDAMEKAFVNRVTKPLLKKAWMDGLLRDGINLELVMKFHEYLFLSSIENYRELVQPYTPEEAFEHIFGDTLAGIRKMESPAICGC